MGEKIMPGYSEASIKAAQYLLGLTANQDIWQETGKVLIRFFGADLSAIGERRPDGVIACHDWNFSTRFTGRDDLEEATREACTEVLESGFLSRLVLPAPAPLSLALLPVTHENRVIAVMLAGHGTTGPLPKDLLNVYLAIAGLVGTIFGRLASEKELRCHRLHLERLVRERTAELTAANEQLHREIDERRQVEEEKSLFEQQLRHAQKLESLGILAGGIAHDFNNILGVIIGNCFLAKLGDENAEAHIGEIESAAERAAELCRLMLAYAGKTQLLQSRVDLRELVEDMVRMLKPTLNKNVTINRELSPDLPLIDGDAGQIRQIVMNLVINACEAIDREQGEIRVSLSRTSIVAGISDRDHLGKTIPAGVYLRLEVADNGCGMDDITRERIFDPFYTTKFTGRGLGMSAVLGIILAHGGALQLCSRPGEGSTFRVYLPVQGAMSNEEVVPEEAPPPWQGSGTILLVDDEEQIRATVGGMMGRLGFAVIAAADGREALELYKEHAAEITLVVTDLGMPVMDGYRLFRELKALDAGLPIVISSGFGDVELFSRIPREAISGVVSKPYNFDRLRTVIRGVLGTTAA